MSFVELSSPGPIQDKRRHLEYTNNPQFDAFFCWGQPDIPRFPCRLISLNYLCWPIRLRHFATAEVSLDMFDVLAYFRKSAAGTSLLRHSTVPRSHTVLTGVPDCKNPVLVLGISRSEVDREEDVLYTEQIRRSDRMLDKNLL